MSTVSERIAETIAAHHIARTYRDGSMRCACSSFNLRATEHDEHVAQAIVDALGIREEYTWTWPNGSERGVPGYGFSVPTIQEATEEADGTYTVVHRYVTEWEPA